MVNNLKFKSIVDIHAFHYLVSSHVKCEWTYGQIVIIAK